ncbi:elongation factor 4 [symbiont of Argiope bruennichi]|uniref:translation elongation factor 4 n=1 Tax=symbiont of Argiope bruennichi TaxID=2810479 RepID=UPI003DA6A564
MNKINIKNIRNFSIIAHIDHGKSTLADRIIEICKKVKKLKTELLMDELKIERDRGITVKLNSIRLYYEYKNEIYTFHLIDTPGHVDFSYEVSRSLEVCDGVILVIDGTKGIQAQTISHLRLARKQNLSIIPAINKCDMKNFDYEKVNNQVKKILKINQDSLQISAKNGINIDKLLEKVILQIKPPITLNNEFRALIFDSFYDTYQKVVLYIKVYDGELKTGDIVTFFYKKTYFKVLEVGVRTPEFKPLNVLHAGEIGYLICGIKNIDDIEIGDTIFLKQNKLNLPIPGYQKIKPLLYFSLFPYDQKDFDSFKKAFYRLKLNDSSLNISFISTQSLGMGFRCGFLGVLHAEITCQRLETEHKINLIVTQPNIVYEVQLKNNEMTEISDPSEYDPKKIKSIKEKWVSLSLYCDIQYIGSVIKLLNTKRSVFKNMEFLFDDTQLIVFHLPFSEVIFGLIDEIKTVSKGYCHFDYEFIDSLPVEVVKVDVLLNKQKIDLLSFLTDKQSSYERAKKLVKKLKEMLPRKNFEIPIQAVINNKIIARETIGAIKKDLNIIHKGDISRRKKLLENQKEGKKKMKQFGKVEIPTSVFNQLFETSKIKNK